MTAVPARRTRWAEAGLLLAVLALAALLRLPGIDARGQWDADQGKDMLVLAAMTAGQLPLLGPLTSVGTFHHGAFYYYLLWPSAAVSGVNPVAVTVEFALLGIGAVAATWWLGRLAGGRAVGLVAGLLMAVAPSGISASTFIWNPNPIPLFAALAFGGVVRARQTGSARWWLLAAFGAMATMQLHWLGGVVVVPVVAAWALEVRRARRAGVSLAVLGRAGLAGAVILAAGYVPLLVHEAQTGGAEIGAILGYLSGGGSSDTSLLVRLLMVTLRVITWPVAGLLTGSVTASMAGLALVVALAALAFLPARRAPLGDPDPGRWPAGWLLGILIWSIAALAFLAPSLAVVVPDLPNDHYHAFLDPVVLVLVATGAVRLAMLTATRTRQATRAARSIGPVGAAALVAALVAIAAGAWPPAVSPDGGWPLADLASLKVIIRAEEARQPGEPISLVGLPTFKSDAAMRFPLTWHGLDLAPAAADPLQPGAVAVGVVTIVCDPLFDDVSGAACGGPAEERWVADAFPPGTLRLVERFKAGPRRVLSVYAPSLLATRPSR